MIHGLHIEYSNVNQAYFLMWHEQVLGVYNTKREAELYMGDLLPEREV